MDGFKKFLLRGNVVDLAVAVVIGAAFGAVVTAFVEAFITPLVGVVTGALGAPVLLWMLRSRTSTQEGR